MNDMTPNPREAIGGNNPPMPIDDILAHAKTVDVPADLRAASKDDLDALTKWHAETDNPPPKITSDAVHERMLEAIKKGRAIKRNLDATKDLKRGFFGIMYDTIGNFYKKQTDLIDRRLAELNKLHKEYSDEKAAAEKKRLAEEAERKRAEEEAALRLAQDAERTKSDAESQRKLAEQAAELAAQARELAVGAVAEAQATLAEARRDGAMMKVKIADLRADFARRRKDKDATATKEAEDEARAALQSEIDAIAALIKNAEAEVATRKEEAEKAKREQREAEEREAAEQRKVREASRAQQAALDTAVRHEKSAAKIEEKIAGPDADLVRTRTEHGAVGTLARQWHYEVQDRSRLDKEALWPFIDEDAIRVALRKWGMQQAPENRKMAGASIYEDTAGQVR
jgi:hypothetical protein